MINPNIKCKQNFYYNMNLNQTFFCETVTDDINTKQKVILKNMRGFPEAYFTGFRLIVTKKSGESEFRMISKYDSQKGIFTLVVPLLYKPEVGDEFIIINNINTKNLDPILHLIPEKSEQTLSNETRADLIKEMNK